MKINWGTGIAIFYSCFMVIMLFFVFKSTTYDNSLVKDDYYNLDLNYQEHYDKISNNNKLKQKVEIAHNSNTQTIDFAFPPDMKKIKGTVLFFNPISKFKDIKKQIKLDDNGEMKVATSELRSGRWKIKIDWKDATKAYYKEIEIVL